MKMKGIIFTVALLAAAAVQASTLVPLSQPALEGIGLVGRTACVGSSFNADSSITGACHTITSSPCSGRGCQPVTYTTNYVAKWDDVGNSLSVTACAVVRHHLPQVDQTTYLNGYTACPAVVFNPQTGVIVVNGIPLYYVTTDVVTGNELANANAAGYLVTQ
jgi:hypothetical protein